MNPKFEEILSLKREDVINQTATKIYKVDKAPYLDIYFQVIKTKKPLLFETYFPPNDTYFKISVISPNKDEFITVFDDISARKIAEQKLKESEVKYRDAYERANFYRDLFAHDISNIMQVINSSAELISHKLEGIEKPKEIERLLPLIKSQIKKSKKLVKKIKILSELEESLHPIKSIELCEFLRKSINLMYNTFPEKEINLQIDSLNKKFFVQANELLLEVFENLLINAIKYNDKQKIELEIKISETHKDGTKFLKIEFRDNSMGIMDDKKTFIFKKGFKEHKSGKGMGFGLALVKKILDSYKGYVWVENRVKGDFTQGSNFILLIPR